MSRRSSAASLPFLLALGCALTSLPLLATPGRASTGAIAGATLAFLATAVVHALVWRGRRWTVSFFAIAFGASAAVELVGVRLGVPFGDYRYTSLLGWRLGGVPLLVPLAWSMMAYPCYVTARRATSHAWGGPLLAALALTAWDLLLDPVMVSRGAWTWGPPYGGAQPVPASNYLGWVLTALPMMALAWRLQPRAGAEAADERVACGLYGGMAVVTALLALCDEQPAVAVTGLVAMAALATLPLLTRLGGAPQRALRCASWRWLAAVQRQSGQVGAGRLAGALVFLAALVPTPASGVVELRPEAAAAFDRYAYLTEARLEADLRNGTFLWLDALPAPQRAAALARLHAGELLMRRERTRDRGTAIAAPGALIHHWMGSVLIPGASLADTRRMAQDYDRHDELFERVVKRSRLLSRRGDEFHIRQRFMLKRILTAVVDTESHVVYRPVGASRLHIWARSTRVAEVLDPDTPAERLAPVGRDSGFLWRVNSYWAIEERSEGVYLQVVWVSLSRSIPPGLAFFVRPIVDGLTRDTLAATLSAARGAVGRGVAAAVLTAPTK